MTEFLNPHLSFPFQLSETGTQARYVEQDSDDEIIDCVEVLLRTPLGWRIDLPEYGVRPQEFTEGGANREELIAAIAEWEERALVVIEREEVVDPMLDRLSVAIKGRDADA